MILTFMPAGAEPREWSFRPLDITSREAELVEDYTGWTFTYFSGAFYAGSVKARRCALWLLLRREDPSLGLEHVDYKMTEFRAVYEGSETAELRRQIEDDPQLEDGERATLLARLAADEPDDTDGEDAEGKDTAPDGAAGSGESPTS
jgi:hypothetical protein